MTLVNLIPSEYRDECVRQGRMRVWGVVVGVALAVVLAWGVVKYLMLHRAGSAFKQIDSARTALQNEAQSISDAGNDIAHLQGHLALWKELENCPDLLEIMGFIAVRIPEGVTLGEICFEYPETEKEQERFPAMPKLPSMAGVMGVKPPIPKVENAEKEEPVEPDRLRMVVKGYSPHHAVVAQLLSVLEDSGFFETVNLNTSHEPSEVTIAEREFEIECILHEHYAVGH